MSAAGTLTWRRRDKSWAIQLLVGVRLAQRRSVESDTFRGDSGAHGGIIRGVNRRDPIAADSGGAQRAHAVDNRSSGRHFVFHDDHVIARRKPVEMFSSIGRRVMVLGEAHNPGHVRLPDGGEYDTQSGLDGERIRGDVTALGDAEGEFDALEIELSREPCNCRPQIVGIHGPVSSIDGARQLAARATDDRLDRQTDWSMRLFHATAKDN